MSESQSPDDRGSTAASNSEMTKMLTRSSARFGTLSHHSFFSRHNPHPSRVRHIQGLNGRPVCTVRDDWYVTSSLFPHPLLKGHVFKKGQALSLPLVHSLYGASGGKNKSSLLSERWRDELKELAAKITMSSQPQQEKKEEQPEGELIRRKTQYSAQTGRIIPPSSKSYQRRSHSQPSTFPQILHDQELMVLELLCQILQTDSLSAVQHWLLLSCQREKDLVMGMIKEAMDGMDAQQQGFRLYPHLPQQHAPMFDSSLKQPQGTSSNKKLPSASAHEKPEKIGDAEVLQVHNPDGAPVCTDNMSPQ